MATSLRFLVVLLFSSCSTRAEALEIMSEGSNELVVDTIYGPVKGYVQDGMRVFRGIPYAAPPLGDLRWRPPQPHPQWAPSVRDATNFGATCIQAPGAWNTINTTVMSEDCLFINVYAPLSSKKSNDLASEDEETTYPVMVYIHAGEFRFGSSNDAENNFPYFSDEIVLVTFNNRLGVFGFLGADELRSRSPSGGTGNYGIEDQREALRWVRKNIGNFGGNPNMVTIFGESSGGTCVGIHLTNPKSFGLFDRAILESPGLYQEKPYSHSQENYRYILSSLASVTEKDCRFDSPKRFDVYPGTIIFPREEPISTFAGSSKDAAEKACLAVANCVAYELDSSKNTTKLYQSTRLYDLKSMGTMVSSRYASGVLSPDSSTTPTSSIKCLLSADAKVLTDVSMSLPHDDTFSTDSFAPVLDGVDSAMSISAALSQGIIAPNVSVMFGSNLDEATEFMNLCPPLRCNASKIEFLEWAEQMYGKTFKFGQLFKLYNNLTLPLPICQDHHYYTTNSIDDSAGSGSSNGISFDDTSAAAALGSSSSSSYYYNSAMRSATDFGLLCPLRKLARVAATAAAAASSNSSSSRSSSSSLYGYHFTHTPIYSANFPNMSYMGACHGCEVPFVFGDSFELKSPAELKLAQRMGCYWKNFASTGNPNTAYTYNSAAGVGKDSTAAETEEVLLQLDTAENLALLPRYHSEECDLFDNSQAYPSYPIVELQHPYKK
eukprot:jgi/Bigna1/81458/fgenesh1_pg.80_\